jgi:hypothetical protein
MNITKDAATALSRAAWMLAHMQPAELLVLQAEIASWPPGDQANLGQLLVFLTTLPRTVVKGGG